jgi:hypothetical protein
MLVIILRGLCVPAALMMHKTQKVLALLPHEYVSIAGITTVTYAWMTNFM